VITADGISTKKEKKNADVEEEVIFGGRLGEFQAEHP
jgi:UDP-galactopyranose mutase